MLFFLFLKCDGPTFDGLLLEILWCTAGKINSQPFSRLLESYDHIQIYPVLNDLDMLGFFFPNIPTPDFHGDPCSCLFILLLTAAMVMHVIDGLLESSATQQFYNCIINNSINSSPHLCLIY